MVVVPTILTLAVWERKVRYAAGAGLGWGWGDLRRRGAALGAGHRGHRRRVLGHGGGRRPAPAAGRPEGHGATSATSCCCRRCCCSRPCCCCRRRGRAPGSIAGRRRSATPSPGWSRADRVRTVPNPSCRTLPTFGAVAWLMSPALMLPDERKRLRWIDAMPTLQWRLAWWRWAALGPGCSAIGPAGSGWPSPARCSSRPGSLAGAAAAARTAGTAVGCRLRPGWWRARVCCSAASPWSLPVSALGEGPPRA